MRILEDEAEMEALVEMGVGVEEAAVVYPLECSLAILEPSTLQGS